ncbi:helix-turn-helix domain-containing protein [Lysinibacillus sphaericus]|uniref:helix-turn-helix domain-containing protein n=1 Tax=Lysinibacillus sphaericus TaxID=1421 RepID=UPI00068B46EE|nr:helix-turn-helix domain-containing protein [Lysinibacillus sphaericus]
MLTINENSNLLSELHTLMKKISEDLQQQSQVWLTLRQGAEYAGVSHNTFTKFRDMGLKICEIDGVKRVSKAEIDRFLMDRSF